MKSLFFIAAFWICAAVVAQAQLNNALIVETGVIKYTFNDNWSMFFTTGYQRNVGKKWLLNVESTLGIETNKGVWYPPSNPYPYTLSDVEGSYPFISTCCDNFEQGFKQLETNMDKQYMISGTVSLSYALINKNKHKLYVGAGGLASYIDRQYVSLIVPGEFNSILSRDLEVSLVVPYVVRFFDAGYNYRLHYYYQPKENIQVGVRFTGNKLIFSKEDYWTWGAVFGVKF